MPQLANVVLKDRASTPVDHTFTPEDITSKGVGALVESAGVPVGNSRLTVGMIRSADRFKPEVRLSIPVVQNATVEGVTRPVVVRTAYAEVKFNFAAESTEQERKDIVGMIQSAFDTSKTVINDTVIKLQGVY